MDIAGNRFLITGGWGLVGSHIADELLSKGAGEVVLFDNGSVGSAGSVAHLLDTPGVRLVQGDVLRLEDLLDAMTGVSGVFHTAAFITLPLAARPVLGIDVNIRGFVNVLESCRVRGVTKVVYTSSIATYGNAPEGVIDERSPFVGEGVQPASALYGLGKLVGEQFCALYGQRHGLKWVALRCSSIYGERQHARGVSVLPIIDAHDRIRQGLRPIIHGDGHEVHDYIYAGDVGRAHVMAMEAPVTAETITIATGRPASLNEVVALVLKACASPLTAENREQPGRLRSAGATRDRFSIEKAAALLRWRPQVSLEEGVARLIAWRERVASE